MLVLFEAIAVGLWLALDNIFYFFNFSYIGLALSLGLTLYTRKFKYARLVVQFAVGLYMLVGLGFIGKENMQIEGFWYFLFLGIFQAATIHYAVAKIFGPVLFGRGWCGYACWTAMVLDLLPYKHPKETRKSWGWLRGAILIASFVFVFILFKFFPNSIASIIFWSFIIGNVIYYLAGILLAFVLKDNRAFCKYLCPVSLLMKPGSYISLMRITCNEEKCIKCNKCKHVCPMNVDMTNNNRKREFGTECILCLQCVEECPTKALKL